jgi:hypothetical protein
MMLGNVGGEFTIELGEGVVMGFAESEGCRK